MVQQLWRGMAAQLAGCPGCVVALHRALGSWRGGALPVEQAVPLLRVVVRLNEERVEGALRRAAGAAAAERESRKEREKGGLAECFAITYQAVPIKRV